jgi:phage gp45-like
MINLEIKRILERICRRLAVIFSPASILDVRGHSIKVEFAEGEIREDVSMCLPYGLNSIPKVGGQCFVVSSGDRNSSRLIAACSDSIRKNADHRAGVVQLLDGEGADITLFEGCIHLQGDKFVVRNCKEDLIDLNKELLGILQALLNPGSLVSTSPGSPVSVNPELATRLQALLQKWG